MKPTQHHLRRLSQEELLNLCDAVDGELLRRQERRIPHGFRYSTYMSDRCRGPRLAPRPERLAA